MGSPAPQYERNPRPLATRPEVAEFLGVPPTTLEKWARRRMGPAYTRIGAARGNSIVRYRWEDVEKWLSEQHRGGDAA